MQPCFICSKPAESFRSLTQVSAPPSGPHDSVPICAQCQQDWSFSLIAIARSELAGLTALAKRKKQPDPRKNPHQP